MLCLDIFFSTCGENVKINLRKQINNSCGGKIPCKWWIRNVEDEEDEFVGPCVELVQIKPWKFRVHTNVDCFEKRRPLCARHLKKEDDLEEQMLNLKIIEERWQA